MKYKIVKKQNNSRLCAVCGIDNPFGFEARFYETDSREIVTLFKSKELQQSFPGRVHGGVITAVLDETIGRAIWAFEGNEEAWGVTVELSTRYKIPVPLNENLIAVGRITRDSRKIFEGTGEIYLPDGRIAVEGSGKYFKMGPQAVNADKLLAEEWLLLEEDDPQEIEI